MLSRLSLETGCLPILTGIRTGNISVAIFQNDLAATECADLALSENMASLCQFLAQVCQCRFETHRKVLLDMPARRIQCLLRRSTLAKQPDHHLGVPLGLMMSTHHAECH